jgi:hypothetical protein
MPRQRSHLHLCPHADVSHWPLIGHNRERSCRFDHDHDDGRRLMALSKRPSAKRKQLANIRPAPAPERGNRRALKHGGRARPTPAHLAAIEQELLDGLPVRSADGSPPAHDLGVVRLLAVCLCRLQTVDAWLTEHGPIARGGKVRDAVNVEMKLRSQAARLYSELGMSPRSRAALGLDLARVRDLALEMAAEDDDVTDADVIDDEEE